MKTSEFDSSAKENVANTTLGLPTSSEIFQY